MRCVEQGIGLHNLNERLRRNLRFWQLCLQIDPGKTLGNSWHLQTWLEQHQPEAECLQSHAGARINRWQQKHAKSPAHKKR